MIEPVRQPQTDPAAPSRPTLQRPPQLAADSTAEILLSHSRVHRIANPSLELFVADDFLPPAVCAAVIELIDRDCRPSQVTDANGDPNFRTSESCDLAGVDVPLIGALDAVLSAFSGIDPVYGEPLQGQRYRPGQAFKSHTDYFDPGGADFARICATAGNRTWTLMIYLNEVAAGGATRFDAIGQAIEPRTGRLLAWNNRRPDGSPNPATLHQGMKVQDGTKYLITKWYRERPFGFS